MYSVCDILSTNRYVSRSPTKGSNHDSHKNKTTLDLAYPDAKYFDS